MSKKRNSAISYLPVVITAVIFCLCTSSNAVMFYDGTFNQSDWELVVETRANGGTTIVSQESGGNPGEYERNTITIYSPSVSGDQSTVWVFHKNTSAVYDPMTQGSIEALDYSEDSIMFSGAGEGHATGPALLQDGMVYYYYPYLFCNQDTWTTQTLRNLTEEAFQAAWWVAEDAHPDFSDTGNPIVFGFWRGRGTHTTSYPPEGHTSITGIDNWSIAVVPEPATISIFALGAVALIKRRQ